MRLILSVMLGLAASVSQADEASSLDAAALDRLRGADVVIAGEVHDNARHHAVQAEVAREVAPRALVFEMLSAEQAERITPELRGDAETLAEVLEWDESGWPDFGLYYPIMAAAPEAAIYGAAVPRDAARAAMADGVSDSFGEEAEAFGLTIALPVGEQQEREAFQMAAHCDALPENILGGMVDVQRLRDAELARATVAALEATGGPVLVITGNGHAREDWGMPVYLERARPEAKIVTIGQGENGAAPAGVFDIVLSAPAPEREDPCAAFQ